jgi:tripartite-type tricarboxylate transporter receptor subunit TctC
MINRRKVGMTSNHHALYVLGYTRATMVGTTSSYLAIGCQSLKTDPSSDCRLQLACMKSELLVIVDQHATVNAFPGLVHTARHTMGVGNTRSQ